MEITHEDFQKARRISRAIQEYLEMSNKEGVRSTDVYPYLAKKGIIEKDRHEGLHFRRFLIKLKEKNLLKLIPQCTCNPGIANQFNEWYFYKADISREVIIPEDRLIPKSMIIPEITENEIDDLIVEDESCIDILPRKDEKYFTIQMKEMRENYPRAYESWSRKELEIMESAYKKFNRIDKVAELLRRQPSVVEKKLKELALLKNQ